MCRTMNAPLIFTVIHIIKALECAEQQEAIGANDTRLQRVEPNATSSAVGAFKSEPPDSDKLPKKPCSCPCNSVPRIPVCGRTTNGLSRTFDSQCHLICYNQCDGSLERYAVTFLGTCPAVPSLNRKNVFSATYENRRIEYASPYQAPALNPVHLYEEGPGPGLGPGLLWQTYAASETHEVHRPIGNTGNSLLQPETVVSPSTEFAEPIKVQTGLPFTALLETSTKISSQPTIDTTSCNCNFCLETRWIRLDYYPICAERNGQRRTFDSWCHFDCENKCVRRTGDSFLYMHKGACAIEPEEEIVAPRTVTVASAEVCAACSSLCRTFYEPVCAKNGRNEYLSFKSRCHMRCHNQCHYQRANENFMPLYEGPCTWL